MYTTCVIRYSVLGDASRDLKTLLLLLPTASAQYVSRRSCIHEFMKWFFTNQSYIFAHSSRWARIPCSADLVLVILRSQLCGKAASCICAWCPPRRVTRRSHDVDCRASPCNTVAQPKRHQPSIPACAPSYCRSGRHRAARYAWYPIGLTSGRIGPARGAWPWRPLQGEWLRRK
jgi:hypothetical protein